MTGIVAGLRYRHTFVTYGFVWLVSIGGGPNSAIIGINPPAQPAG